LLLDPRQRQQPLCGHVSALGGDLSEVDGPEPPEEAGRLTKDEHSRQTKRKYDRRESVAMGGGKREITG